MCNINISVNFLYLKHNKHILPDFSPFDDIHNIIKVMHKANTYNMEKSSVRYARIHKKKARMRMRPSHKGDHIPQ